MTTSIRSVDPKLTRVMTSHVTHQTYGHITHEKRYISTFTRPMAPKLGRVLNENEGPHTKVHVTLWSCSHVKIQEHHISSTSRPMAPKLSSLGRQVQSQMALLFGGHPTKTLYLHFHKTYTPWHWLRMRELHLNIYN